MEKLPIVAFLYDFDKTLCTTDMQNYSFIPSLGMTPAEFWPVANSFGSANRMDGILAYMYTMISESDKRGIPLTRESLGVPVIAIGVPTVVDAGTLAADLTGAEEIPRLGRELLVTPKDIDSRIADLSKLIGYGLDLALQEGLTVSDVELFLS